MKFLSASHPIQVKDPLANDSVVVKYLIELAELEEQYFFVIILLDLPILFHRGCETFPHVRGNPQSCFIVELVPRSLLALVFNELLF